MSPNALYAVTHEVFVPFDYGDDLEATPFDDDDLRWLREVFSRATEILVEEKDADLLAEVVTCLRLVRAVDLPAYRDGLDALLAWQQEDGHWGVYDEERERIGDLVVYEAELHTTVVAVEALALAFHPAWNESVEPVAPPP
jgi:hypothetical protein